jgi:hypothetical protein
MTINYVFDAIFIIIADQSNVSEFELKSPAKIETYLNSAILSLTLDAMRILTSRLQKICEESKNQDLPIVLYLVTTLWFFCFIHSVATHLHRSVLLRINLWRDRRFDHGVSEVSECEIERVG